MKATRREFLAATAAATLAGRAAGAAANEKLGIGVIGCGNRGNALISECMALRDSHGLDFVALCDVWKKNREDTADRVAKAIGHRPKTFSRFAELLALPEVDAVIIATPDFAHSPILVEAAKAKKHAYVEKPMATRLEDANAAVDAVEANGVVCQVGTQKRSEGMHIAAAKLIQSGVLGTLIKCHTAYNDNGPRWQRAFDDVQEADVDWEQYQMFLPRRPFDARRFRCWHLYQDYTVGLIGLLGVHPIDVAHFYTEDPLPVSATGIGLSRLWTDREHYDTQECLFTYPKGHLLQFSSWLGNANGGPQNVFFGAKGTFDTDSWTARGDGGGEGRLETPVKVEAESTPGHIANWLECVRAGDPRTNADVHAGYAHSVTSIMGAQACKTGQRIIFDAIQRTIKEG